MEEIRNVKFKDDKIFKLLEEKKDLLSSGKPLVKKMEDLNKKVEVINNKIQKIKDKLNPLVQKFEKDFDLKEFEVITSVEIEGDEIRVDIVDQLEAYKKLLRSKNEGTSSDTNGGDNTLEATK